MALKTNLLSIFYPVNSLKEFKSCAAIDSTPSPKVTFDSSHGPHLCGLGFEY